MQMFQKEVKRLRSYETDLLEGLAGAAYPNILPAPCRVSRGSSYLGWVNLCLAAGLSLLCFGAAFASAAKADNRPAACRSPDALISDRDSQGNPLQVSPAALKALSSIGLDRDKIFQALAFESVPEARGCWASPSGNFDTEILSVGAIQWNFGTKSLQTILRAYQVKMGPGFEASVTALMPEFGKLIFSWQCLRPDVTAECKDDILSQQNADHTLKSELKNEVTALFASDAMRQVQTDAFVALLESVQTDLQRLYPAPLKPSLTDLKWAIDSKVQQGNFPGDGDILRVRQELLHMTVQDEQAQARDIIDWYSGLCRLVDQGGVRLDCLGNVSSWGERVALLSKDPAGPNDARDKVELLFFSNLRARIADTESGYYQALAFQRRARIALGVGTVAGSPLPSEFQAPIEALASQ